MTRCRNCGAPQQAPVPCRYCHNEPTRQDIEHAGFEAIDVTRMGERKRRHLAGVMTPNERRGRGAVDDEHGGYVQ